MFNVHRCLALLEELTEPPVTDHLAIDLYYESAIKTCERLLNVPFSEVIKSECFKNLLTSENLPKKYIFSIYVYYSLIIIVDQLYIENDPEVLSVRQQQIILKWINLSTKLYLGTLLHDELLKNPVLAMILPAKHGLIPMDHVLTHIQCGVVVLSKLLGVSIIVNNAQMDMSTLQYLAALHTLEYMQPDKSLATTQKDKLYSVAKVTYFKFLLILKSTTGMSKQFNDQLHEDLLKRLVGSEGFECLCKNVIQHTSPDIDENFRKRSAIIAGIVGRSGHSEHFYASIIAQISTFTQANRNSSTNRQYIVACLESLIKIYNNNPAGSACRIQIEDFVFNGLKKLAEPEDIITGNIILDHNELLTDLDRINMVFCGAVPVHLRSDILIQYLPLLLQLFNQIPNDFGELRKPIEQLVVHCLANRGSMELSEIVDRLLSEEYSSTDLQINQRVFVKPTVVGQIMCQIGDINQHVFYSASDVLVRILKASKHNILIYNIFLLLFSQLEDCLESTDCSDLIDDLGDMTLLMSRAFKRRIAVIGTLSELINYKPFHFMFNENPLEILTCLTSVLRKKMEKIRSCVNSNQDSDPVMMVIFSIVRELFEKLQYRDNFQEFVQTLFEFRTLTRDRSILNHIDSILALLDMKPRASPTEPEQTQFERARVLCAESEPHLKAYGLMEFKKLVQSRGDAEVMAKRHAILAIAIEELRDADSYVFLNCIRLLVALVDLLEAEVLETMVAEFRMEDAATDYRLKVAEVIIKITEELGPLSIKYKATLINCFLLGCTNANAEIRTSSLANMGTICRLLSYQVHNFFQEIIHITHTTITNDSYLPARRASVLVLVELISGFDKLQDFQDIVLAVHRALKYVAANETDQPMVIHAQTGIAMLTAKVKDFLTVKPEGDIQIKVLGINEPKRSAKGRSILEII